MNILVSSLTLTIAYRNLVLIQYGHIEGLASHLWSQNWDVTQTEIPEKSHVFLGRKQWLCPGNGLKDCQFHVKKNILLLVCGFNPSKKYWSVGVTIPNIWKNEKMFQTTNHFST